MQRPSCSPQLTRSITQSRALRTGLRNARGQAQRGYALIELSVALIFASIIGMYAVTTFVQQVDDASAASTGQYLDNLVQGSHRYILTQFSSLADGNDIATVANDLTPSVAELIALGRLPTTFPATAPGGRTTTVRLTRTNCPGLTCQISSLACLDAPMAIRGKMREDLTTVAMMAMNGRGARSHSDAPSVMRGPNINAVNPVGATSGILCAQSVVDAGIYDAFVKIGDTRDPALRAGLTVSGNNPTGETLRVNGDLAVVNPATGNVCVQIQRDGVININCNGQLNATTGTFTGPSGTVRVGAAGTNFAVDTAGRIRGEAGFWTALGSLFGDNSLGLRAANSVFTIQTNAAVDALAVHDSGRTGSRTSVATPMLGLTDAVTSGTSCSSAAAQVGATQVTGAAQTVLRAIVGGGLATCDSATGTWVSATTRSATESAACSPNGSMGQTSQGVATICTNGLWATLTDRTGYTIQADMWRVVDGSVVAKPICGSGSTGTRLILQAGNEQQAPQFVNRRHVDNGGSWTVSLRDGTNNPIPGDMIAMSYCLY